MPALSERRHGRPTPHQRRAATPEATAQTNAEIPSRHLDPEPEVRLGRELAQIDQVTACIDVSDGLSTDLHHLCDASNVGADIERERIPIFPDLGSMPGIPVQDCILHGGEEYALLFTASLRESELSARVGRPVYAIGRISGERGVRLNGETLEAKGYEHF